MLENSTIEHSTPFHMIPNQHGVDSASTRQTMERSESMKENRAYRADAGTLRVINLASKESEETL